jgi:branched-chain amino acid transport system substrate-binding protein
MISRLLLQAAAFFALASTSAQAEIRMGIAAPMTGTYSWSGEQVIAGAEKAVKHINDRGGVLGESLVTVLIDDFCNSEQAVVAANKLITEGVRFVVGHQCSGAAISASPIYEQADTILISPVATNPKLTERGLRYAFRVCGRDDLQGTMVSDYIAKKWPGADIAIVSDDQQYGQGIAEEAKRRLEELGIGIAVFEHVKLGQKDFSGLIDLFETRGVDVAFYGGYQAEAGLIVRQAKSRLPGIAFIMPDGISGEDFGLIAGDASEGILMTNYMNAARGLAAADVVDDFRADGIEQFGSQLYAYAAVQAWAQAAESAGATDAAHVAQSLRSHLFDTVLGRISFNEKGDVAGFQPFTWYIWKNGKYVEKDLTE